MIRPLRTAHRTVFFVLAILLPVLVCAALVVRDPQRSAAAARVRSGSVTREYERVFKRYPIKVELVQIGGRRSVRLSGTIPEPDVLIYVTAPGQPLESGRLLGSFSSEMEFEMPQEMRRVQLVIYSAGRGRTLDQGVIDLTS